MAYGFEKTVLDMHAPYYTLPCRITNTGINADNDGKKIIKAGTPVGSATSVLESRTTVLVATNDSTNGSLAQGVLVHDVDVTNGSANCTVAFMGVIDLAKCESTLSIYSSAKTALNKIIFMKGRAF